MSTSDQGVMTPEERMVALQDSVTRMQEMVGSLIMAQQKTTEMNQDLVRRLFETPPSKEGLTTPLVPPRNHGREEEQHPLVDPSINERERNVSVASSGEAKKRKSRREEHTRSRHHGEFAQHESKYQEQAESSKRKIRSEVRRVRKEETSPGDEWITNMVKTPFSSWINETNPPSRFNLPSFELFDGTSDPKEHILRYHNVMLPIGMASYRKEATMCKLFVSSLKGPALTWFHGLEPDSINSFEELAKRFTDQFATSIRMKKEASHLFAVIQRKGESLKAYAQRFNREKIGIPHCNDSIAIEAFRKGLIRDTPFYESLTKKPPRTMVEALERARKYINLEDDRKMDRKDDRKQDRRERGEPRRGMIAAVEEPKQLRVHSEARAVEQKKNKKSELLGIEDPFTFYSLNVSPEGMVRHLRGKDFVTWPRKMQANPRMRDGSKFCAFHNDFGHFTKDCRQLMWEIESLIKRGYLGEFMSKEQTSTEKNRKKDDTREERSDHRLGRERESEEDGRRVIHTIHGGPASGGETMTARRKHLKAAEVAIVGVTEPQMPSVIFTQRDAAGLHFPHDDALVVKLDIGNCMVKRVLIDNGSSVDIIFLSTLREMRYDESKIERTTMNLVGFNGEPSTVIGKVVMPITVKGVTVYSTMMVVKVRSAYNAILGRPWLHMMRAVPSTYHQMLKFPNGNKIEELHSDQRTARACYVEAMKGKAHGDK